MTVSLKHKFASVKADGDDASLVRPSNWNDEHDLVIDTSKIVGRTTAGTGSAEEIGVSSELTLSSGTLGIAASLGGKEFTGPVTITSGTQTVSTPALNMTQTWNNVATTFTGYKLNVTNTASNSASLLMDLQVDGVTKFKVDKAGGIRALDYIDAATGVFNGGGGSVGLTNATVKLASNRNIGWSSTTNWLLTSDLLLTRKAAASLQLGAADAAAPVAQTLGVQSVVAGTTNTAGANFTIAGSQGTGTGVGGNIVFRTAAAGSTGTAQNALGDALTIEANKTVSIPASGYLSAPNVLSQFMMMGA